MKNIVHNLFAALFLVLLGASVFAGGTQDAAEGTTAQSTGSMEAPALAEMVKAGTLPALEDRLPKEPLVLKPVYEIGQYGGDLKRTYASPSDGPAFTRLVWEPALRFTSDGQEIIPNVAKSWDVSSDGKVYTLNFREGMKWSDGTPFTADDVLFWYNNILLNEELNATPSKWMMSGGEVGIVDKIDDYSVTFTFANSNAFFIRELAFQGAGSPGICAPAHYLKQFHPNYTDQAKIDQLVKDAGLDSWIDLFAQKNSIWDNTEMPTLGAWKLISKPGESRMIAERNPYYWKVDPDGKQLPYMERVIHDLVENPELVLLKASNGEIDVQFRHLSLANVPVLRENEVEGEYTVYLHAGDRASMVTLFPNMSHEDPVYSELMNNTEFKRALMYSIDRDEVNELLYFGLGTPRAVTSISSEPTFEADVAQMNIKYDPVEANRILDSLGFDKRDKNGIRLGPDGEPIFFLFPTIGTWAWMADAAPLIAEYFKEIGIDTRVKSMERSAFYQMSLNNEIPLTLFTSPGTSLGNPWWVFPRGAHNSPAYGKWFTTNGAEGIEPPEGSKIRMAMELYEESLSSPSLDGIVDALKQILRWANEEIWAFGIVGEIPAPGVVKNNVGNVIKDGFSGTHLMHPGNLNPEQWYFK